MSHYNFFALAFREPEHLSIYCDSHTHTHTDRQSTIGNVKFITSLALRLFFFPFFFLIVHAISSRAHNDDVDNFAFFLFLLLIVKDFLCRFFYFLFCSSPSSPSLSLRAAVCTFNFRERASERARARTHAQRTPSSFLFKGKFI